MPRSSLLLHSVPYQEQFPILSSQLQSLVSGRRNEFVPGQVSSIHNSALRSSIFQRFGLSSSASPEASDKEHGNTVEANRASTDTEPTNVNGDAKLSNQAGDSSSEQSRDAEEMEESDSESKDELSMDDLIKLVTEKEELLMLKKKEIEKLQDKVVRSYAEIENVVDRTRRDAENTKKFAIQKFAKSLLDVADNLGRASSVVKESFAKIDTSKDSSGAVPLLKTLLEGVEMTEKQLVEVFKKYGIEKFDPTNEPFDPNRHNAVFEIPDNSKPAGTVAAVLKSGYVLYDRVIRPAEVGVTRCDEPSNTAGESAADKSSEA